MSDPNPTAPITTDQAMAALHETYGSRSPVVKRIRAVMQNETELFDAASCIAGWLRTVRVEDRPLALFNRLEDAINSVREAHQMDPDHVLR